MIVNDGSWQWYLQMINVDTWWLSAACVDAWLSLMMTNDEHGQWRKLMMTDEQRLVIVNVKDN